MKPDAELRQIAAVARAGSGRSPLYRWLRARHDAFAQLVEETRPNWTRLAEGFGALGLTGWRGRPLTGAMVQRTWWRVRRDVAALRQRRQQGPRPAPAVVVLAPPTRLPTPASADTHDAGTGQDALARLRAEMDARSGRTRHG
jgi:hypothetical protein